MLAADQLADFQRDGFVTIPDAISAEQRRQLRTRALDIVDAWEPTEERSVFTTNEQDRVSNKEFLDSGSITWCFFEEEAFGPDGELTQPKERSINKIGHAQHDLDDEFERFAYQPLIAEVADDIGMDDPRALQSMYIFKQPHIGGEVGCHQDAAFLYTDPISVTGFWFAIEDATLDNGCLWAAPGGHHTALRQLFKRTGTAANDYLDADGTEFEELDTTPLPEPPPRGDTLVPIEVPAGTMVVLDGLLPHWSDVNRSAASRHAYTLHCISGAAEYPAWNWLRRPNDMPLRPLGSLARP
ncbi:MAG: phytanoyl-CoA dioxygenase family protein [Ilumatobacteraceae bacterium]|nr:phytanoyl-CoA dioxygenase family protein [Ilumatobacteraceae bacterium]